MRAPSAPVSLRGFGLILAAFLAVVFGAALPALGWLPLTLWAWLAAALIALAALMWPPVLRPVYVAWTALGRVLGWINTRLLLGIVFFALIWPMGAARRLLGRPSLAKAPDRSASTYRRASQTTRAPDHFERPY